MKIVLVFYLYRLAGVLFFFWVMAVSVGRRPDWIFLLCPLHILSVSWKYLAVTVTFSPGHNLQWLVVMVANHVALVRNPADMW